MCKYLSGWWDSGRQHRRLIHLGIAPQESIRRAPAARFRHILERKVFPGGRPCAPVGVEVAAVERGEAGRGLGVLALECCLPGRNLRPFEEILGVVPGPGARPSRSREQRGFTDGRIAL